MALRRGNTPCALTVNNDRWAGPIHTTTAAWHKRHLPESTRPHPPRMDHNEPPTTLHTDTVPKTGFAMGAARGARLPGAVDRPVGLQHRQLDADGGRPVVADRARRGTGDARPDGLQPARRAPGSALGRGCRPLRPSQGAPGRAVGHARGLRRAHRAGVRGRAHPGAAASAHLPAGMRHRVDGPGLAGDPAGARGTPPARASCRARRREHESGPRPRTGRGKQSKPSRTAEHRPTANGA